MHVETAKTSLGVTIPWIVDTMDNQLKHALGDRPNSEFVIGPDGNIVRMRDWSSAEALRADLTELVGAVSNPTDPRSLGMQTDFAKTEVARGVVERVRPDGPMTAFLVETKQSIRPAYIKLRAEGDGRGKLYLGFFVDPIHKVHWNNLAGPIQVEVNGKTLIGPTVTEKADGDPREFLVDVDEGPVDIKLKYVACDDKETWCDKLTQDFIVTQVADRDAGRVSGARPGGGGQRGGRQRGSQRGGGQRGGGQRGGGQRGFGGLGR